MFSPDWVALSAIQQALEVEQPFTSAVLRSLHHGKSANNAGFLMAVLLGVKLVKATGDKSRLFVRGDSKAFADELKKLAASKAEEKPKPAKTVGKGAKKK
jgi:hypothetical protein